jgi:hypothetical protein
MQTGNESKIGGTDYVLEEENNTKFYYVDFGGHIGRFI